MIAWGRAAVEALDHEIVWVGTQPREPIGAFGDLHHVSAPVWRLVAGYLMLEEGRPGVLGISSHGHPIGSISVVNGHLSVELPGGSDVTGQVVTATDGIAIVADPGTTWAVESRTGTLTATSLGSGGVTIVHGPAPVKIDNRIRLLESLRRVGGRRA